jgi:hypothetical protein
MSNIFYHGTNRLFDKFDLKYAYSGEIFVSPCNCRLNSMSYLTREGGYLYTIEIDESNDNFRYSKEWGNNNCECRAYSDVSGFKILKVECIDYNGKPVFETECGSIAMMISRKKLK